MKSHAFERGQTLPILAVTVLVLVAVAGFAADVGYHQFQQRVQQTATDSAAMAAAAEFNSGTYADAGKRDAASNGFTDGVNNVQVTVQPPQAPDPYAGTTGAVEADIVASYPTFFEKVFNIQAVRISTKAVALADSPSNLCIVALDTRGTSNIDAHSVISAPDCDVAINNSNLSIGGQSTITTHDPIHYSGSLTGAGTSTFSPAQPVPALPITDPCRQITACRYLQDNPPDTTPCINYTGGPVLSYPTIYCRLDLSNTTTTLAPGMYVVTNNFNANRATISGTGVTIVFTGTNNLSATNANFDLSAPTSGDLDGMLLYAPNYTQPLTLNGGDGGLQGIIYAPQSNLTLNAGNTIMSIIIAGQLSLNSSNTTFSAPPNIYVTIPRLVE